MKSILTLWITTFILASCVAPQPNPDDEPYVDWKRVEAVVKKAPDGSEARRWTPRDGDILVYPRDSKVEFIDDATGEPVTVTPSFSIIYEK